MNKKAAPPVGVRAAKRVICNEVDWIFGLASDDVGCHGPWAMDAERQCVEAMRKAIASVLVSLPKTKLIALGRQLHELSEACDFEIDQLERDQYDD